MGKKIQTTIFSLATAVALIWFDQWTKGLAVTKLKGNEPYVLIPGIFELNYTENRGAAFGLMQNQSIFFLIVTLVVLAGVVYLFCRMPFKRFYWPLRAILVITGSLAAFVLLILLKYKEEDLTFIPGMSDPKKKRDEDSKS